jgi:uncharacterized protein
MVTAAPGRLRAVLLFARSPESEGRAKRQVARGPAAARRVHELLLKRALRAISNLPADIDVVLSTDDPVRLARLARGALPGRTLWVLPQAGATAVARLADALARAEGLGFSDLAVIGADAPGLETRHLARAFELAESGAVAVGPAVDGGFYLLAGRRDLAALVAKVPFGAADAADALLSAATAAGRPVALLERLADLDAASDLGRVWADLMRGGNAAAAEALASLALTREPTSLPLPPAGGDPERPRVHPHRGPPRLRRAVAPASLLR